MLGAYVSYEVADWVDIPQVDERLKEGLTAEYYFNEYVSVYGRFEHTDSRQRSRTPTSTRRGAPRRPRAAVGKTHQATNNLPLVGRSGFTEG